MYIVVDGEIEVQLDQKRKLIDADMKEMDVDLNLNSEEMSKLLSLRLSNGLQTLFHNLTSSRALLSGMSIAASASSLSSHGADSRTLVKVLGRGSLFRVLGIIGSEKKKPTRPYHLVARSDATVAGISKLSYRLILERIKKKVLNKELAFLKSVEQLSEQGKRVLSRLYHAITTQTYKRGQLIFREGEDPESVYIIKEGECELSKLIFEQRHIHDDKMYLTKSPSVTKKFTSNFVRMQGLKPVGTVKLAVMGPGKLLGEDEVIREVPHTASMVALS